MTTPPDLIHHLTNDVYRAVRHATLHDKWKRQESRNAPPPFHVVGSSNLGIPGNPGHIIHAEWAEGHSEANRDLGIPRPHSILVERDLYDSISYEVTQEAWADWEAALITEEARRTLWLLKPANGKNYWYPNQPLGQAPQVGLKLTQRLLEAGLIWQASLEQFMQYRADQTTSGRREPEDVILEALEAAG